MRIRRPVVSWWNDRPLIVKGRLILAAPLLALATSSIVFLIAVSAIAESNEAVQQTEQVRTKVNRILAVLVDAESGVRGYLLTEQERFLEPYRAALAALPRHRAALTHFVADDPTMTTQNAFLSTLINVRLVTFRLALDSRPLELERIAVLENGKDVMDEIRGAVSHMDAVLTASLTHAESAEDAAVGRARWAAVLSVLLGVLGGSLGIRVFVGGIARGVKTNTENTERLARASPLAPPPDGADEIGRSGRALVRASELLAERERTIRKQEDLLSLILASISDGVVVADSHGRLVLLNDAAEHLLGLGLVDGDPSGWSEAYGMLTPTGEPYPAERLPLARALRGESVDGVDLVVRNPQREDAILLAVSGRPMVDENGNNRGGVVTFRDVTEARERDRRLEAYRIELERLNRELHAFATLDALTGLPNRRGFEPVAEQLVSIAERKTEEVSLLFIDLDGLKRVNDLLGHDVGSQMIVDVAEAIRAVARRSDAPARIGGDEFCLLLTGGKDVALRIMSRLREHVARFDATSHRPYKLSMSMGYATSTPSERSSLEDLMRLADAAMYEDKRSRQAQRSNNDRAEGGMARASPAG